METQIHVTLVKHAAICRVAVQTVRLVLAKGIGACTCKHQNIKTSFNTRVFVKRTSTDKNPLKILIEK